MDIQKSIRMAVDTGEVVFGKNESINSINRGASKMVIIAGNVPQDIKVGVLKRARLAEVGAYEYEGTSMELGSVCGKPYPISIMSIIGPGDSDVLLLGK